MEELIEELRKEIKRLNDDLKSAHLIIIYMKMHIKNYSEREKTMGFNQN